MLTRSAAFLALSVVGLAVLPGCLIVATDRHYYPSKKELANTREVNPSEGAPTIRSEYKEQLSKLHAGMTVDEFKTLFPGAIFSEQQTEGGHSMEMYSLRMSTPYHYQGGDAILTATDEAFFTFSDGKLIRWAEKHEAH